MHREGKEVEKAIRIKEFGEAYAGKIRDYVGNNPACIMGFQDIAEPYSLHLATFLSLTNDVKHATVDVEKGRVKGFYKGQVYGRKILVITETPFDRGSANAKLIAKRYLELERKYDLRGFAFVTVNPTSFHDIEEIQKGTLSEENFAD